MMIVRSRRATLLAILSLSALAACEVGVTPAGGGDDDGDDDVQVDAAPAIDAAAAVYQLAVTPATASTILGTDTTFTVTVDAQRFDGPVTLTATGAPTSWTVAITPSTVNVIDGGSATATVKVTIPPNGDAAAAGQVLTINAESTVAGAESSTAVLTVAKEYDFKIGSGTGAGTHFGALNGGVVRVKAGTLVKIQNLDGTQHRIHSGGGIGGFPHQDNNMASGDAYAVTVTDGSDSFYCHIHGQNTGDVNLVVE